MAKENTPPKNVLFSVPEDTYGDRYKDHLIEQYKILVESALQITERRTSANNYLLAVNSSLVTAFGLLAGSGANQKWLLLIPLAGIVVTVAWSSMIRAYRALNSTKFKLIHELEVSLPLAIFRYEWQQLEHGEGRVYRPLSKVEMWIPMIFAVLHFFLGTYALLGAMPVKA